MIHVAKTSVVWLALGSNLGDRQAHLNGAILHLEALPEFRVLECSTWVETKPVGGPSGQGDFLNGVLCGQTEGNALQLLDQMQHIEREFGRQREVLHGPRTLDLDLLLFGSERIDHVRLQVPHPALEQRSFVLEPLAQLAPLMRLPGCGLSVRERLDQLRVTQVSGERYSHVH